MLMHAVVIQEGGGGGIVAGWERGSDKWQGGRGGVKRKRGGPPSTFLDLHDFEVISSMSNF